MDGRKILTLALLAWLAGCATSEHELTQDNIDRANKVCERKIKSDQAARDPMWFSKWIACKKERIMPFDIAMRPDKEAAIRAMYDELAILAIGVDYGIKPVQSVYREWDRMQDEININQCLVRVEQADGSSRCRLH
jgi:hypothetical protein